MVQDNSGLVLHLDASVLNGHSVKNARGLLAVDGDGCYSHEGHFGHELVAFLRVNSCSDFRRVLSVRHALGQQAWNVPGANQRHLDGFHSHGLEHVHFYVPRRVCRHVHLCVLCCVHRHGHHVHSNGYCYGQPRGRRVLTRACSLLACRQEVDVVP